MEPIAPQCTESISHVVRIGQTVRRPAHRNTPIIQALLRHLEKRGFDGAPRPLGVDQERRETVGYIFGEAGQYPLKPHVLSESTLIRLGLLLRRFHDATTSFSLPKNLVWHNTVRGTSEVICHGDAGPYNIIFRNGNPVALIDFERATPGPRVWDIAFVVYRFAPLCDLREQGLTRGFLRQIAYRIRSFLQAYGFSQKDDLLDWIRLRLETEIGLFESVEKDVIAGRQQKIEAGHLDLYKRDLRLINGVSDVLRTLIQSR
jgi:hypothetical protein